MEIKKDNPVPSIKDVYEWMERNKDYDKKSYGCKIHKQKTQMLESLFLMLNTIKQYGVETNNEQPMLKKCKGCGDKILPDDYYNFACPECGEENNR